MPDTLHTTPSAVLTGAHQRAQPLPVDGTAGFVPAALLAASTAAYTAGDGASPALVPSALVLPEVPVSTPSAITLAGTLQTRYPDSNVATPATVWNVTVPSDMPAGAHVELVCVTQDSTTVGAPSTPAGWNLRGTWAPGNGWIPRITKFWRQKDGTWGANGSTVAVTFPASCHPHFTWKVFENVDPDNPYDVAATWTWGYGVIDPPAALASVTANALVNWDAAGNVWPTGADSWNPATQLSPGYALVVSSHTSPRFLISASKLIPTAGTADNPGAIHLGTPNGDPDQWLGVTDTLRPILGADLAVVLAISSADDTAVTATPAAPVIPAQNEIQDITSTLAAGTVTLTLNGQTTAAIAYNATHPTIQAALEALASVAPGDVIVTGGPLNSNPVSVEFAGAYAATPVSLMTDNSASVTVTRRHRGRAAQTFQFEGSINVPRAGSGTHNPQTQLWSLNPAPYVAGDGIDITVADHGAIYTWAASLGVFAEVDTANPVQNTFGPWVADQLKSTNGWGAVTPDTPGGRVLAILAKARPSGPYPGAAPVPGVPDRYTRIGQVQADAMTLDVNLSAPLPATAETPSPVTWSGAEDYTAGLAVLRPRVSAGSVAVIDAVTDPDDGTWLELAGTAGQFYEIFELDLTALPTGAILTGVDAELSHAADARATLRVTLVGIRADGSFVVAPERRPGGYVTADGGAATSIEAGTWVEFDDSTPLSTFDRLGILVWTTNRNPATTSHRLLGIAAAIEYEPGGPVVSNVTGPAAAGDPIGWDYASASGYAQTHSQARLVRGWGQDPDTQFTDLWFSDWPTVGPATTVLADATKYELYDGPGNAGNGLRRPSGIDVIADASAWSGNVLRIKARNGSGADAGNVVSGGLKILEPITYGEIEFRARGTGDPDLIFSPVVILWPRKSAQWPTEADVWPAGGEIDMGEAWGSRDDLDPMESNIHRLRPGSTPPYTAADDEFVTTYHAIDGTAWHKYRCQWLPTGITISIDDGPPVQLTPDPSWVPGWPMEVTIQLDAWNSGPLTGGNEPELRIDYLAIRRLTDQRPAVHPLRVVDGEIIGDTGKTAGGAARSWLYTGPLPAGNSTAQVRAWTRLASGLQVVSPWELVSFDLTGNPPGAPAQAVTPVFNPDNGAVVVTLDAPADVSRAWLARTDDTGFTWALTGPFTVPGPGALTVVDWLAPLARPAVQYEVAFDAGPMTEATAAVAVGGPVSTVAAAWWAIVPDAPELSTVLDVYSVEEVEPRRVVVGNHPDGATVVTSPALPVGMTLGIRTRNRAQRDALEALLSSGRTIRIVDVLGREGFYRLASDVTRRMQRWAPTPDEVTGLRDGFLTSFSVRQVRTPDYFA